MNKSKPQLLIVEDDISSQQYYSVILEPLYDLSIVPTAKKAKEVLKESEFDLIIIDIFLPGGEDGKSLIKYIRSRFSEKLPIIAITAHALPQNREEVLKAGATEFLTKPIMGGVLHDILNKYLPNSPQAS
ncbi:response regulator [bacterium]|nr:response regulator [bacterium]